MEHSPEFGAPDSDADRTRDRRHRRVVPIVATALLVAAIGTAIGLTRGGGDHRAPAATGLPTTTTTPSPVDLAQLTAAISCDPPKESDRPALDQLDDFAPVALFTCGSDERSYSDGDWTVEIRKASTAGIPALIAAMHVPAAPLEPGMACGAVAYTDPAVAFVDGDGRYLIPAFRQDACDAPIGLDALEHIDWQDLAVRKVQLDRSAAEITAGCSHQYKNMNYVEMQSGGGPGAGASAGGPVFPDDGATLHACVYRTAQDDLEVGTFVTDKQLDAAESDQLRAALAGAGPAGDCTGQQEFALVFDGKNEVDVELGGCHRVLISSATGTEVGTADASVLQGLFGQP